MKTKILLFAIAFVALFSISCSNDEPKEWTTNTVVKDNSQLREEDPPEVQEMIREMLSENESNPFNGNDEVSSLEIPELTVKCFDAIHTYTFENVTVSPAVYWFHGKWRLGTITYIRNEKEHTTTITYESYASGGDSWANWACNSF